MMGLLNWWRQKRGNGPRGGLDSASWEIDRYGNSTKGGVIFKGGRVPGGAPPPPPKSQSHPPPPPRTGAERYFDDRLKDPDYSSRYEREREFQAMTQLVGSQVKVELEDKEDPACVEGLLLTISDSGEVVVRDEMGFNHYCWPALRVVPCE